MSRTAHPFRTNQGGRKIPWSQVPTPDSLGYMVNEKNSYLRVYRCGECSVIVTREGGRWHLSIAHRLRLPTWDEVATARYKAIPDDAWMAMVLPPKAHYINVNENCLQLKQIEALGDESS